MLNKKNNCQHINYFNENIKFCKKCLIFIPQSKKKILRLKNNNYQIYNPYKKFTIMIKNQLINRNFNPKPFHLELRPILLNWMKSVCYKLGFSLDTIKYSIFYFDSIFSKKIFKKNELKIILIQCILIAAKFNEMKNKIPILKNIYGFLKKKFTIKEIESCEILTLELLKWQPNIILSIHFIKYFLSVGILFIHELENLFLKINKSPITFEFFCLQIYDKFENILLLWDILTLYNYNFYNYTPLAISASIIAVARKNTGFNTYWNEELEELTFIKYKNIKDIVKCINNMYKKFINNEIISNSNNKENKQNNLMISEFIL